MAINTDSSQPVASSSKTTLVPGPTTFHESSQFRHWRYSQSQLRDLRLALNAKSVEVVTRNSELEKEAQISLGHESKDPPPQASYLSVEDELLLLRQYLTQAALVRQSFYLPEYVESTAMTYLKRFYLRNSVMDWHPKAIMPTCVYLAAKTTNYPIPMSEFTKKFAKLSPDDIYDTEFLVSQTLSFEFWTRGADKALRGWALDLQSQPDVDTEAIQRALPVALETLSSSRLTDAEFIYTPAQIALACFRVSNRSLVDDFLDWRYDTFKSNLPQKPAGEDGETAARLPYGMAKDRLVQILQDIEVMIKEGSGAVDVKKVKEVDKRLKLCTNPEKIPGTALYIKRKQEMEASNAAARAVKTEKMKREMDDREMVFGDVIQPKIKVAKKDAGSPFTLGRPLSPRVTIGSDRGLRSPALSKPGEQDTGMGIPDEAMGLVMGGKGLLDVGKVLDQE